MSDAPQGAPESAEAPQATDPTPASAEPASEQSEPDREQTYSHEHVHQLREEAKRNRLRFRESEEARAQLQQRLDAADRKTIERVAAERLNEPDDLWLIHTVGDFRAEDGTLDEAVVQEVVDGLVAQRPHWAKPAPSYDGGVRRGAAAPPSFGQALKQRVTGGT